MKIDLYALFKSDSFENKLSSGYKSSKCWCVPLNYLPSQRSLDLKYLRDPPEATLCESNVLDLLWSIEISLICQILWPLQGNRLLTVRVRASSEVDYCCEAPPAEHGQNETDNGEVRLSLRHPRPCYSRVCMCLCAFRMRSDCKYSLVCLQLSVQTACVWQGKTLQSLTFLVKTQHERGGGEGRVCVGEWGGVKGRGLNNFSHL